MSEKQQMSKSEVEKLMREFAKLKDRIKAIPKSERKSVSAKIAAEKRAQTIKNDPGYAKRVAEKAAATRAKKREELQAKLRRLEELEAKMRGGGGSV